MYNNFYIKSLFFLLLIITIGIPINNVINLSFIIFGIFFIFFCEIKKFNKRKIYLLWCIFILIFFNIIYIEKDIHEAHSTFFSKKDIQTISNFLPYNIINDIEINYSQKFDIDRALKSSPGPTFSSEENFAENKFIENHYSFSTENYFFNSKYSRDVNQINFNSREKLRLAQINTLNYNLRFDKEFRRNMPYYVFFELQNDYKNSKICGKGNIYYKFHTNKNDLKLKNNEFTKLNNDCVKLDSEFSTFNLIGYSINKDDQLSLKLYKNIPKQILDVLLILSKILFILFFYKFFFKFKRYDRTYISVFLLSIIATILIIIIKDQNLLFGLRYFRGGADGLFHEYQGLQIIKNFYNFDIVNALKGGEDVFYFMPGLRYFIAISKIFNGDTSYAYLIIGILLPIFLYNFLKNLISKKIAFVSVVSFLFIPIFENIGFGHFNYIHQIMRNHAETLSITIIIYTLSRLSNRDFFQNINFYELFFITFILAFASFCRPNFFPTTSLIVIYLFYNLLFQKRFYLILSLSGYLFIFSGLLHNIYYGNDISLFTQSNLHFINNITYQKLNINNLEDNLFLMQILKWNPLYNLHRLIILFFVIYCFIKFEKNSFIFLVFSIVISQHIVLLITHPDSRYAYLAWFITFILFLNYLFNNYLKKLK